MTKKTPSPHGAWHYVLDPGKKTWRRLSTLELTEALDGGEIADEAWISSSEPLLARKYREKTKEPAASPARRLVQSLSLPRPLVFFDLESTGAQKNDRIVEFAGVRVEPDGETSSLRLLVNPGIPIPAEVVAIHGITDEMVKDVPRFPELAPRIGKFLEGADLAGYNIQSFDVPMLIAEFERAKLEKYWDWFKKWRERAVVDVCTMYQELRPRSLGNAFLEMTGRPLKDAHSALADVEATLRVLARLFERGEVEPSTPEKLEKFVERRTRMTRRNLIDMAGNFYVTADGDIRTRMPKHRQDSFRASMLLGDRKKLRGYCDWVSGGNFPSSTIAAAEFLAESLPVLLRDEKEAAFLARWKAFVERARRFEGK